MIGCYGKAFSQKVERADCTSKNGKVMMQICESVVLCGKETANLKVIDRTGLYPDVV